ncbi:MAG: TRAP transporter large permease [Bradymonadaceae bacterium]|nr:TRAP transporter large permease [Lujinxingiaceae bacterium]
MADLDGTGAGESNTAQAQQPEQVNADAPAISSHSSKTHSSPTGGGGGTWFFVALIALILTMILLGVPLYVLIGSLTMYLLFFGEIFTEFRLLTAVIEQTRGLSDQTVLLAIPFFVIAGAVMTEGDIARRLIAFAESLFGHLPGGLAISTVFACAFFAAISGSSPVTVIAIGSIMYPALLKKGYPEDFSCGLVTSGGSLGILIPPSIPMIVYAIVDPTALRDPVGYSISSIGGGESSVKDLFIAGMLPGLLIGVVLALWAMRIGFKFNVEKLPFSFKRLVKSFINGFWALFLPVLILGGIYSGLFTPTQAAAVAVVYAIAVEFFIHRSLSVRDLPRIFGESAVLMGSLLIIMALALGFNLYLDRAKIPEAAVELILSYELSIITFLLIVNVLLIFVGFFMDILSAILILVPLLAPIAFGLGIHPLHMAIIFIVNLEIGYLTPPIGLNLFVAGTLFKKGLGEVVRSVVPFMLLMLGCLVLVTYVPSISLGLVSLSKGGSFYVTFPDQTPARAEPIDTAAPLIAPQVDEPPAGVKTLEQMMQELEGGTAAPQPEDAAPARVKTLEELMQQLEDTP